MTDYPETIAPLVMDSSHMRCATRAITDKTVTSSPETLITTYENDEIIGSITEPYNNKLGLSAIRPHTVAYSDAGLMTADTKRPYDEAHLCTGLLTYGVKAYYNATVCMRTSAEAYYNADAYECNQSSLITGHSQNTLAFT